jgi:hypothetical protein
MPTPTEVYDMVTKQKGPAPGALERQQKRQVRTARNRRLGAYAAAAAVGVVAVVLAMNTGRDGTAPGPADTPAVTGSDAAAVAVATEFLDAFGALDADAALAQLADDADLSGIVGANPRFTGTPSDFRTIVSWYEVLGWQQTLGTCHPRATVPGTLVECSVDYHLYRSDELGNGPYEGTFAVTVRGGEVVAAALDLDVLTNGMSRQSWQPFAAWWATSYPDDPGVKAQDGGGLSLPLPTTSTIPLYDERLDEYVREMQQG